MSGRAAAHDVPVHVIARRNEVLSRLRAKGFGPGLAPARPGAGEMHALVPMLLEAFGARE